MPQSEKQKVLAANATFYDAFCAGDMDVMRAVWSDRETICVFHPNTRGIEGRTAVMRSWEAILGDGGPQDIRAVDPIAIITGKSAMVICEEKIGTARMIATNLFANEDGVWMMIHHQATRLPESADSGSHDQTNGSRREKGR